MKKKKLITILLISLIILSCKTVEPAPYIKLQPIPAKPVLTYDPVEGKRLLVIQYYKMLIWAYSVKYQVGEITIEEYEEKREIILNTISQIERLTGDDYE